MFSRRQFLLQSAFTAGTIITNNLFSQITYAKSPGIITLDKNRPNIPYGVASGDITGDKAVIWSRTDRPARMIVQYSPDENLRNYQTMIGQITTKNRDFTSRIYLDKLPRNTDIS
jgi:alkaline phosphatase D